MFHKSAERIIGCVIYYVLLQYKFNIQIYVKFGYHVVVLHSFHPKECAGHKQARPESRKKPLCHQKPRNQEAQFPTGNRLYANSDTEFSFNILDDTK